MKTFIFCMMMFICFKGVAQLHSGTPVIQPKVQPVPNSSTAEKSASPQPINIPPAANPVKPVYPGADVKAVEIPRQLINPPETPSGTQPKQKEPLSPIESTNILQPNRPPRDEASRINQPVAVPATNSSNVIPNKDLNSNLNSLKPVYNTSPSIKKQKKPVNSKQKTRKILTINKKPHYY